MMDFPLLSVLVWLPILGGVTLLVMEALGFPDIRPTALIVALATFLLSMLLYTNFDMNTASMQFQELAPWIAAFKVNYHLGVDGISMPLIILTTFTTVLV
ncbi:MAG: NADH-quinone oxidoreductase subunit M, partial [Gammaproteobacteria bacterium]|nr:NADH-quinone oxidoreductase subunit M [Gammaproteobacteria bacterium]